MTGPLMRILALTSIYLLVLTSINPPDVFTGLVLSTLVVLIEGGNRPSVSSTLRRLGAAPALVGGTLVDVIAGAGEVIARSLGFWPLRPGTVTVPIEPCSAGSAAAWGIRVGLAPNTVVVDVDEQRGELLLHVLDASEPDGVVRAELNAYQRRQRRVFP